MLAVTSFIVLVCVCAQAAFGGSEKVSLVRTPDGGIQPQAALDEHGTVHLIYYKGDPAAGDLFYVKREAGKEQFSKPLRVNSNAGSAIAVGSIRGGQMAVGKNGRVHVAWDGMGKGADRVKVEGKEEAPLLYARLNDQGTAFEPERNVIQRAFGLDGGSSTAADRKGNVYVFWHAPQPGSTNGEAGRAVFLVRSTDEGKTFGPERLATGTPTGACGCCGMKAFADGRGNLFALYRAASNMVHRGETLLVSRDGGEDFKIAYSHNWQIASCPMSSAFLSETKTGVLAAAETHGRVFYMSVNPDTGKVSDPVSSAAKAKHPVAVSNEKGEVLLAWTEGTAWAKGGAVAWRIYDQDGKPTAEQGRTDGVPVWSVVSAVPIAGGKFLVFY